MAELKPGTTIPNATPSPTVVVVSPSSASTDIDCVKKREIGSVSRVLKIGIMGDGTVGKTTFLLAYITHGFITEYTPTVFDNFSAIERVNNETVNIILWDLAGQDEYSAVRATCLKASHYDVLLLCFSVIHRDSFENVKNKWIPELKQQATESNGSIPPIILVGCKSDLRNPGDSSHISIQEAENRAKEIKALKYLECSAKNPDSVRACLLEGISLAQKQKPQTSL